jgi:hypothetical protein
VVISITRAITLALIAVWNFMLITSPQLKQQK